MLRKNDVLLEFAGVPIANDGTVHFRHRERIYFSYLITLMPTGERGRGCEHGSVRKAFATEPIPLHPCLMQCSDALAAVCVLSPAAQSGHGTTALDRSGSCILTAAGALAIMHLPCCRLAAV